MLTDYILTILSTASYFMEHGRKLYSGLLNFFHLKLKVTSNSSSVREAFWQSNILLLQGKVLISDGCL